MDNVKMGQLIRRLRKENSMTQLQLAEKLHVSDKAVSKWERGIGGPEVSLITQLSGIFAVDMQNLLSGELNRNDLPGGNMKKLKLYICPHCGNLITSMTDTSVTCCGRKLQAVIPQKATEAEKLSVQIIEHEFFISSDHEMTKDHHITFVALLTSDTVFLKNCIPSGTCRYVSRFLPMESFFGIAESTDFFARRYDHEAGAGIYTSGSSDMNCSPSSGQEDADHFDRNINT